MRWKNFDDLEENWQNFKQIILSAKEGIHDKSKVLLKKKQNSCCTEEVKVQAALKKKLWEKIVNKTD